MRPIEDLRAADAFVQSLVSKRDEAVDYSASRWGGWALVGAFQAGIDYARALPGPPNPGAADEIERLRAELRSVHAHLRHMRSMPPNKPGDDPADNRSNENDEAAEK